MQCSTYFIKCARRSIIVYGSSLATSGGDRAHWLDDGLGELAQHRELDLLRKVADVVPQEDLVRRELFDKARDLVLHRMPGALPESPHRHIIGRRVVGHAEEFLEAGLDVLALGRSASQPQMPADGEGLFELC